MWYFYFLFSELSIRICVCAKRAGLRVNSGDVLLFFFVIALAYKHSTTLYQRDSTHTHIHNSGFEVELNWGAYEY